MVRRTSWLLSFLAGLALPTAFASAQEGVTFQVQSGGAGVGGASVTMYANGQKQPDVGATDDSGNVTVRFDLANGPKPGDRVTVFRKQTGTRTELVLVDPDPASRAAFERDCEEERKQAQARGEDYRCDELGVIIWGETTTGLVNLTSTGGTLTTRRGVVPETAEDVVEEWTPSRFVLTAGGKYGSFPNAENVPGRVPGVSSTEADKNIFGGGAWMEFYPHRNLGVGAMGYYYPSMKVDQVYAPSTDPDVPVSANFDMSIISFGGYAIARLPGKKVTPWIRFGISSVKNDADVTWNFDDGTAITEQRDKSGRRDFYGGGIDVNISPKIILRLGYDHVTPFKGGDFDRHHNFVGGVGFNF